MHLHYKQTGETGPPVIILHGFLGSLDNWQTVAKQLGQSYSVYSIDQRNHGRSPHAAEMDYNLLSEDIVTFCADLKLDAVILIGHSMGGKVAMVTALRNPMLVQQLVVVDIAPVKYEGGHEDILDAMVEAPVAVAQRREEIDTFLQQKIQGFNLRQFIMKNLARDPDNKFEWKCNLDALVKNYPLLMDFPAENKTYKGPVSFIKGEQSGYITGECWNVCTSMFPNAALHSIPYAGHWVHADNPEHFLSTLEQVLKNSPGNAGTTQK